MVLIQHLLDAAEQRGTPSLRSYLTLLPKVAKFARVLGVCANEDTACQLASLLVKRVRKGSNRTLLPAPCLLWRVPPLVPQLRITWVALVVDPWWDPPNPRYCPKCLPGNSRLQPSLEFVPVDAFRHRSSPARY